MISMGKIIITQSILWAAVLATISIGTLKNGINSIKN